MQMPMLTVGLVLIAVPMVMPFSVPCSLARSALPRSSACVLSMAASTKKSKLNKALIKNTLTVSCDVAPGDAKISKILRRIGIATIFASSDNLGAFCEEQQSAKGDFPGPVPVMLREAGVTTESIAAAKDAGAAGIVLPLASLGAGSASELAVAASAADLEVMWEVRSLTEYDEALSAGAEAFLVSGVEDTFGTAPDFWRALPKGATLVAEVQALQERNSEIGLARELGAAGCRAVMLAGACTGGEQDHKYVDAATRALRSKGSQTFQVPGLTGKASAVGLGGRGAIKTKEPTCVVEHVNGY